MNRPGRPNSRRRGVGILRVSSTQFDPDLVGAFLDNFSEVVGLVERFGHIHSRDLRASATPYHQYASLA